MNSFIDLKLFFKFFRLYFKLTVKKLNTILYYDIFSIKFGYNAIY